MKVIGTFSKRIKDTFGDYETVKYDIIKIDEPRNIRGKVSFGNWVVDYYIPNPFRDNKLQQQSEYFWRKKEALSWINSIIN